MKLIYKPAPGSNPVPFWLLEPKCCKFILNCPPKGSMDEAKTCGLPTEGGNYCGHHQFAATVEAKPLKPSRPTPQRNNR